MDYLIRFWTSAPSLVGMGIVLVTISDIMLTVLSVSSGPGPITKVVSASAWRVCRGAHTEVGRRWPSVRTHWLLRAAGPAIVVLILVTWIVLMIVGWGLVFGQEGSLLQEGEVIEPAFGRVHYAAALILGRGTGEFNPGGGVWRFAEQLAAMTGVFFVGVTVAYVLPVINGVVHRRAVAATIATLGGNPNEILRRAWNGHDLGDLDLHLIALTPEIALLSQHHLAYPVITYFHSGDRVASLAPAVAVLDETLTLLTEVVEEDVGCGTMAVLPCRAAITDFLRSLAHMGVRPPGDNVLPRPPTADLRWVGIPLRPDDEVDAAYGELEERRGRLAAFLRHDAADPLEIQSTVEVEDIEEDDRDEPDEPEGAAPEETDRDELDEADRDDPEEGDEAEVDEAALDPSPDGQVDGDGDGRADGHGDGRAGGDGDGRADADGPAGGEAGGGDDAREAVEDGRAHAGH